MERRGWVETVAALGRLRDCGCAVKAVVKWVKCGRDRSAL